jgi:hypothetical protein
MGVEARHKAGKLYYYRKRREGDRVVSEYVGGGLVVDLQQKRAEIDKAIREGQAMQLKLERLTAKQIDHALNEFSDLVDTVTKAVLISMGYHQHHRQWRRRRDGGK